MSGAAVGDGVGARVAKMIGGSVARMNGCGVGDGVGVASWSTLSAGAGVRATNGEVNCALSVGAGVGVGVGASFSVVSSVLLVNTVRLEFGAGVALASTFVA